jgi:phytol kinase
MGLVYAVAGVFALLLVSEALWRAKIIRGEVARKFVHIGVGTFVAFWPYFMSWQEIILMSVAFLVVVLLSRKRSIFHAVHEVARPTQGEAFFAIGIGLSALLMPSPMVFTAAMLHLSLADGLAAVVGKHYGSLHQYRVRNYVKTLAGTCTFYLASTIIITGTVLLSGNQITWPLVPLLVWLPLAATVLENFAVGGADNVVVPLLIVIVLQASHIS